MSGLSDFYPPIVKASVTSSATILSSNAKKAETFVSKVETHYHELELNYIINNKPPRKIVIEYIRNFVQELESSDSE
jgi:hypothetical protein